jgi:hypothetical protein
MRMSSMSDLLEKARRRFEYWVSPLIGFPRVVVSGTREVQPQRSPELFRACHPSVIRTSVAVQRKPQPYWQEYGWQRKGDGYEGCFRVNGQSYKGKVKQSNSALDFYIIDPPAQVRHNPCFRHRGNGSFWIHWHGAAPRTVSSGIMSVEYKLRTILA